MPYRFVSERDEHFDSEPGSSCLEDLVQEIWITRDRAVALPFQLVDEFDPQVVLRFVNELPRAWIPYLEPEQLSAVAHAVCARLRERNWRILWSVPIISDCEVGEVMIWGVTMEPNRMRNLV
jgi:hypothetical protein